jgi:uncharacterized repeat protein (TIGR03803 family)
MRNARTNCISDAHLTPPRGVGVVLAGIVFVLLMAAQPTRAQTLKVLYSFTGGSDGGSPQAGLIRDAAGNLYGTTSYGGNTSCLPPNGCGTVFKLDSNGTETVLYSFDGSPDDGELPRGSVAMNATGDLYGTTYFGGSHNQGTLFKLNATGAEKGRYIFAGGDDGANPYGGLVRDKAGNIYGTTSQDGNMSCNGGTGCGTVFKLDTSRKVMVLYTFTGWPDGAIPEAGLVLDGAGNLYGTTYYGGSFNFGTVFKLDQAGVETVLHSFGGTDGRNPDAGLALDSTGNLYGTTEIGGDTSCNYPYGCGTAFKVSPSGSETTLYSFTGGEDGEYPRGGLVLDPEGNLYGTTYGGFGTLFQLDKTGKETTLYTFSGSPGGANPAGTLVLDAAGNLYGTTYFGGLNCTEFGSDGCGVVFEFTP